MWCPNFNTHRKAIFVLICALMHLGSLGPLYAQSISDVAEEELLEMVESNGQGISDPFSPQALSPESLSPEDLILQGIVWQSGGSYALVSGVVLRVGEQVAGYRIESIGKDNLQLVKDGKTRVLRFSRGF